MSEKETAGVTPVMAQYLEIKAQHPDALLFYRMGDFYELFFEDAEKAAEALGIALTRRGKHLGRDIPMCGVPVHSAESYLHTLIRQGFHVAIVEQMEDPAEARKRGSKAVLRRETVRTVTPGTLTEDGLLERGRNNHLAALCPVRGDLALAWVDISTGALAVSPTDADGLGALIARVQPAETLVPEGFAHPALAEAGSLTRLPATAFDSGAAERRLRALYRVATLDAYGSFGRAELGALGALVSYVELTQRGRLPSLRPPLREAPGSVMEIDAATRRNLEITRALSGGREGSLIAAIDRTVTGAGARLLEARLNSPATGIGVIRDRHDAVEWLAGDAALAERLGGMLRRVPDMERALTRLSLERGGPRDLAAIRDGLAQAGAIAATLPEDVPALLAAARAALTGHEALAAALEAALVDEPPLLLRDGGFVAPGHHAGLDEARRLRDEGRGVIAALEGRYREETGIPSLKIRHNNVLGYFVETTATHARRMMAPPLSDSFIHRQTTANQVRFTTVELSELETRILNAGARALEIEAQIFAGLVAEVRAAAPAIAGAAAALAEIDLALAFARLAREEGWVRPRMEESRRFHVTGGRHPVVEQALRRTGGSFVANDLALDPDGKRIWLVTGPNMAGKSTFLRQNALIAVLAQAGAFVPAESARLGIVRAAVQPGRRGRRPGARAVHLHGRDGRDRRDPEPRGAGCAGDPGRDRPRHRHLRRVVHRLGGAGASARGQPLPRRCSRPTITS
ncbi:MAG: hypothetical protein KatS3mg118_0254 [Paracoccaceae bacterium]|nr:MAG: hypothetical protein KatS3mg118_0254 [Paracoccaceae bacterium]